MCHFDEVSLLVEAPAQMKGRIDQANMVGLMSSLKLEIYNCWSQRLMIHQFHIGTNYH